MEMHVRVVILCTICTWWFVWIWNIQTSIVTAFKINNTSSRVDGRGSIPGRGKRFFLLHSIQAGFGAHSASNPMGTKGSFPGGEADQSLPYSVEVKNGGAIHPLPCMSPWKSV
jgi:hypothetical protein